MSERKQITWNKPMLARFKVAYAAAVEAKQDSFKFDGNDYVVGYAKYLIEYLNGVFGD